MSIFRTSSSWAPSSSESGFGGIFDLVIRHVVTELIVLLNQVYLKSNTTVQVPKPLLTSSHIQPLSSCTSCVRSRYRFGSRIWLYYINPYLFEHALEKLDRLIGEMINIVDEEMSSQGSPS
ncbi:hypothetical protein BDR03DRAFT_1041492 [Suillus americanus]|nr:hypothetical protein BDR03DRAFT_1041492 [Suillus americanus]